MTTIHDLIEVQRDQSIASAVLNDDATTGALIGSFVLGRAYKYLARRRTKAAADARRILRDAAALAVEDGHAALVKRLAVFMRPGKQRVSARGMRMPMRFT